MAARVVPASVSAIRSRALKVPISWSVSAMARSISPAWAPLALSRATDSSSRLRNRLSGVRRSCATESVTSRRPFISRSMRSSMRLRFSASASNSSPEPLSGTRRVRSPLMISPLVRLMVSRRLQHVAAEQRPADRAQDQDQQHRPGQGGGEHALGQIAVMHILRDQDHEVRRQRQRRGRGRAGFPACRSAAGHSRTRPCCRARSGKSAARIPDCRRRYDASPSASR